jgi:hypothetical protein
MRISFVLRGLAILLLGPFAFSFSEGFRSARRLAEFHQAAPSIALRHSASSPRLAAASERAEAPKARYSEAVSAEFGERRAVGEPIKPHSRHVAARAKHADSPTLAANVKYRPPGRLATVSGRQRLDIRGERKAVLSARDASGLLTSLW